MRFVALLSRFRTLTALQRLGETRSLLIMHVISLLALREWKSPLTTIISIESIGHGYVSVS